VVCDPSDYAGIREELETHGSVTASTRHALATKAFAHTARYDGRIAEYLSSRDHAGESPRALPTVLTRQFRQIQSLRYGENPHQSAGFYAAASGARSGIAGATQLQGKELSYNNINDADAALACVRQFDDEPACVIVKHANPCGVACGQDLTDAYDRAFATDPVSSFGGIIAFNGQLDAATAAAIIERQFVEVILAPGVSPQAREVLSAKPNVRVLEAVLDDGDDGGLDLRGVSGGLLVQDVDSETLDRADCRCVTKRQPSESEWADLLFAWKVAHQVKSNAIVYAAEGRTLGVGAGQMSRVDSARIARLKAGEADLDLVGSAMASDAFFPFRDGIDMAAEAGIASVIQPGGSMRDDEVIAAADEHGMAMVFTGTRHFRH
jgi:phosphoribosylaminoimidazolecarboxamide formyltransferase/IMP cyclohydrolase